MDGQLQNMLPNKAAAAATQDINIETAQDIKFRQQQQQQQRQQRQQQQQ
jgi:hypothetical protein